MRSERLELPDGGSITYDIVGEGEPLLLISGLSGVASFWEGFAARCAPDFRVVLHDHRGTGRSSRCDRPYSVAGMADDVEALMDHLGIEKAVIVGHSTGGAIGQLLAMPQRNRVSRLVLSASWARSCGYFRRLFASRLELLDLGGIDTYRHHSVLMLNAPYVVARDEEAFDRALAGATAPHPLDETILRRRIGAILEHDTLASLKNIRCPTLTVVARDDIVTPAYHSVQMAEEIEGSELTVLPRGGHFVPLAEPELYAAAVLPFLRLST